MKKKIAALLLARTIDQLHHDQITDEPVVIAMCVFFAVAFWAIDSGVLAALKGLLGITM